MNGDITHRFPLDSRLCLSQNHEAIPLLNFYRPIFPIPDSIVMART